MAGTFRDQPVGLPPLQDPRHEIEGVPILMGLDNVLKAVKHLCDYGAFQSKRDTGKAEALRGNKSDETRRARALEIIRASNGQALTESAGKQLLALYDIPVTQERLAQNASEAARMAKDIGFPVAMKIVSPQIMHKTEAGGVVLNVTSEAAARAAFKRIMQNAQQRHPSAALQGVSVQEMVSGGTEMILGMTRDAQFGPGIIVGLGGIFVEILKDVALRVPPLTADDACELLESLKGKAILQGARGRAPADLDALIKAIVNFSQLCLDLADDVKEIDINPLLVLPVGKGAKALDCLIVPV
jgi:acetyltransferase